MIPFRVTKIGELAFSCCKKLKRIDFQDDSELTLIKENAFTYSALENFVVPPKVSDIGDDAFAHCSNLQIIEISDNSKLRKLRKSIFKNISPIIMVPPKLWEWKKINKIEYTTILTLKFNYLNILFINEKKT